MKRVLANAHLIEPGGREGMGSLLIRDGVIADLAWEALPDAPDGAEVLDCGGHMLAPGLVDLGVKIGEPGERHKESFRTGGRAAAAGGVTTMVTRPDTDPPIDNPESLEFVMRRARETSPVRMLPLAALTKARQGAEMTEIGLLRDAGAVGFTDVDRVVRDTKVLARALAYAGALDALVIHHPQEPILTAGAVATSGAFATRLGLPSVSPMAERMGVARDLALAEMTRARLHLDKITTAAAVPLILQARDAGLPVTAGANIHHLTLNEFDVDDYRTFFKVTPPLRAEADRMAVVDGVAEGAIDVIGSFHTPQDEESKRLPFEDAAPGAVGLETLLPAALRLWHAGAVSLPQLFACMSLNPSRLLGQETGRLAPGAPADLVLFDPHKPYRLDRHALRSKSKNTPFDLMRLQGVVLRSWVAGTEVYPEADE